MKTIYRIARLELQTLFFSPIAWLIIVIFTFQAATIFANFCSAIVTNAAAGYAIKAITKIIFSNPMGGLYSTMVQHLYLYIPLLTMGLMSREFGSGSIKLLYSSPVTNIQIILGKFLSMMIFGLVLVGILLFFVCFAGINIEHFDYLVFSLLSAFKCYTEMYIF